MTNRPSHSGIYTGVRYRRESRVTARPSIGDDLRFKHPFSCFVCGPRGSCKSSICIRFLRNNKALCTEPNFSCGIVLCYFESSAIHSRQLAGKKHVRFHGVPSDFKNGGENPTLIILDDLFNDAYSKDVCDLFTKRSHHRNISVILIT